MNRTLLFFSIVWFTSFRAALALTPAVIRCESAVNPVGIGVQSPLFSWECRSNKQNDRQTSYEIDFDGYPGTGEVTSGQSVNVVVSGLKLKPFTRYTWRVRLRDRDGVLSGWSQRATFVTGMLHPSDWRADWISYPKNRLADAGAGNNAKPAIWFRKDFTLTEKPDFSMLTIASANYFEVYVNGKPVSKDVLTPAVSDARKQLFALSYDISRMLKKGKNCIAFWVGNGWADSIQISGQLNAVIKGERFELVTDNSWKSKQSPLEKIGKREWNNFGGERFDERIFSEEWNRAGVGLTGWDNAVKSAAPRAPVSQQICPPNVIKTTIRAQKITALGEGRYEIDFGTNLTGWFRLNMPLSESGKKVKFYFADRIFPDGVHTSPIGNIDVIKWSGVSFPRKDGGKNLYQNFNQVSEHISAGRKGEFFCNKFNYAGFRYVVVEGLSKQPDPKDATAMLVESDMQPVGSFECSDTLINKIHKANVWTLRSLSLGGYMVDCPHRERMGYGDGQVSLPGMMMNFNSDKFYEKWACDWRQTQDSVKGSMPNTAPWGIGGGGPAWPGLIAAIPWQHYLHYGNIRIIRDNYQSALNYTRYLDARSTGDVLLAWGKGFEFIGDWVPPFRGMDTKNWPSEKAAELFCNCYRVYLWQLIGQMAKALDKPDDVALANDRVSKIRSAVHKAFYDPQAKQYVIDEQIYYAMPLLMGVTPESERALLIEKLRQNIQIKNKGHLDTGMLGTLFLIDYLNQIKQDDLVLSIYQQKTHPGWGYMVENGATTLWEQWNGYWSQIHSCFTSADNWLYRGLAGIQPDPDSPGFKKIIFRPAVTGDIKWVKASHESPYGRIVCNWERVGNRVKISVVVPPNTSARIYLPGKEEKSVDTGSGSYHFDVELN